MGAAKAGQEGIIQVLMMAGISPDQKCKDEKTLTHHAAEYAVATGDADVLRKLVDYGANLYLRDGRGKTVLDILKASPKLEAEARSSWLGGSRQLGIKDSSARRKKSKHQSKRSKEEPQGLAVLRVEEAELEDKVAKLRKGKAKLGRGEVIRAKESKNDREIVYGQRS